MTKRMESKVAKPARLQELIVIILECTRFNYSPKRICYNNQIKTSEAITIRYITEDAQRLRAEAKAAGCSLSELIRERSLRADMEAELLKIRIQKISAQLCRHNLIVHEIHDKDARNAFLNWEAEAWQCLK